MPTKPVISYVATAIRPLSSQLNVSIIQKKVDKTTYTNFADKTEFTNFVDTFYVPPTSDCYVFVQCQCGMEHTYADKTEVPSSNLTCSCGRKILEYGA